MKKIHEIGIEIKNQKEQNNKNWDNKEKYYKVEVGNLFDVRKSWTIEHCISQDKFMGKGIAFSFVHRFPNLRRTLKSLHLGETQIVNYQGNEKRKIANIVTKNISGINRKPMILRWLLRTVLHRPKITT